MNRLENVLIVLLIAVSAAAPAAAQGISGATPIPSVTGPIPVTADSYPLMAASRVQNVIDLPKLGYVEEEFFVSGRANVKAELIAPLPSSR